MHTLYVLTDICLELSIGQAQYQALELAVLIRFLCFA